MKYRSLTSEELSSLEKEFIDFLVINGVTPDQWSKIKSTDPKKTAQVIDQFSDAIFEQVLRKTNFIEFRSPKDIKVFQCLEDKIVLVGISIPQDNPEDLRKPEDILKLSQAPPTNAKVYTTEKTYSETRERELFKMLQNGCMITDDKLFKTLCLALPE